MLRPKPLLLLIVLGGGAAWLASRDEAMLALAWLAAGLIPWVIYDMWRIQQLRWWLAPEQTRSPHSPRRLGCDFLASQPDCTTQ